MTAAAPGLNAQRAAMSRAMHQILDHPRVFDDPLAVAIAGGENGIPEEWRSADALSLRALAAARSRYAEDELNRAISRGATQYVIVGAGLDTYAYRKPDPNLGVFEVDDPAAQAWKRTRLNAAGIAIPASLAFAPADFEQQKLAEALAGAGFQTGEVSFFSWLGVSPYPSAPATLATLGFIGSLPSGSGVVFDYATTRSSVDAAEETAMNALASRLSDDDESLQLFVDSRALHKLLRSVGFHAFDDLGPAEIDQRYFNGRTDGLGVPPGPIHLVSARV